jgi:Fe2+ transport protein
MDTNQTANEMKPSKETNVRQLALGARQGTALGAAVHEMTDREAHGRRLRAGEYTVVVAVEDAEGLYLMEGGHLKWTEPSTENAHFEIAVLDAADGRFIPNLDVTATVVDSHGVEIGTYRQPFLWHPWLYHYGRNWTLPNDGEYTIRVHVDTPDFPRHDKVNGCRYTEPIDVEFSNVHISTGQKRS